MDNKIKENAVGLLNQLMREYNIDGIRLEFKEMKRYGASFNLKGSTIKISTDLSLEDTELFVKHAFIEYLKRVLGIKLKRGEHDRLLSMKYMKNGGRQTGLVEYTEEPSLKVICYNSRSPKCKKTVNKEDAFYIPEWDVYYCGSCYLDLTEGKPVHKPKGV